MGKGKEESVTQDVEGRQAGMDNSVSGSEVAGTDNSNALVELNERYKDLMAEYERQMLVPNANPEEVSRKLVEQFGLAEGEFQSMKDILLLNKAFKELGSMVHNRGDIVDSIEAQVNELPVNESDSERVEQLKYTADYQRRLRRRKCIKIGLIILIVILIFVSVFFSVYWIKYN